MQDCISQNISLKQTNKKYWQCPKDKDFYTEGKRIIQKHPLKAFTIAKYIRHTVQAFSRKPEALTCWFCIKGSSWGSHGILKTTRILPSVITSRES